MDHGLHWMVFILFGFNYDGEHVEIVKIINYEGPSDFYENLRGK